MNPLCVVIPSKSAANLVACLKALSKDAIDRVIVVDDGLDLQSWTWDDLSVINPCEIVSGVKPFVFARNLNIGIKASGNADVVSLNDDCLLETPCGLTALQCCWYEHQDYGVIGAVIDSCGTPEQMPHSKGPIDRLRTMNTMVVFAAAFIPRATIDRIGLLDERFGLNAGGPGKRGYGCEDDDYSWRCREAGLKLGVYDGCWVNHTKLPSTFRADKEHPADVFSHEALFEKKWGRHPRRPIKFPAEK